jgi:tetratricopeptide (TPR) repeat protein
LGTSAALADAAPQHRWEKAQALLDSITPNIRDQGYTAITPHLADLEQALSEQNAAYAEAAAARLVLSDGPVDKLADKRLVVDELGGAGTSVWVHNPYPEIAIYLGSWYNEYQKYDDALRVLDLGLVARQFPGLPASFQAPYLLNEKGVALCNLGRLPEGLAAFDDALTYADKISVKRHASLLRSRGSVLTQLSRLDEAEASFRESLTLEPDSQRAKEALDEIARIRGGTATPSIGTVP